MGGGFVEIHRAPETYAMGGKHHANAMLGGLWAAGCRRLRRWGVVGALNGKLRLRAALVPPGGAYTVLSTWTCNASLTSLKLDTLIELGVAKAWADEYLSSEKAVNWTGPMSSGVEADSNSRLRGGSGL
jgi:hypothetical protein